jgi:hypothetical protein
MTLRQRNTPDCLPVLTLADPDRIQRDRQYAEAVVERLFGQRSVLSHKPKGHTMERCM